MKLATLKEGGRDGTLVVVSRDLRRALKVATFAPTLQVALDDWSSTEPMLAAVYTRLNDGVLDGAFDLDPRALAAPLPRAYQWADGSAYVNHVELVRKARGAEMPATFWTDPLMYQGGSDSLLGACDDVLAASEDWGIDFEGEVAVVTDDVPMGVTAEAAAGHIKLLMLANDVSLRNLIPNELAKGFGFFQAKPATAFSPVAVTPDELGEAWDGRRVHLPLVVHFNGAPFGRPNAGVDMTFDFAQLIAHAARTRFLAAGTIVGSGTVSNVDRSSGSACLAEQRMLEQIASGKATTAFMRFGDRVRLEMFDAGGSSIFGAIDQAVVRHPESGPPAG
jgi:fumarylacetoacetate (FAA) hydrolase